MIVRYVFFVLFVLKEGASLWHPPRTCSTVHAVSGFRNRWAQFIADVCWRAKSAIVVLTISLLNGFSEFPENLRVFHLRSMTQAFIFF